MTRTLGGLLLEAAGRFPRAVAVRTGAAELTLPQLSDAAGRLSAALRDHDLGGARVGILLPNVPAFPIALHALFRCGYSALLLNPANSAREIEEQMRDAEVTTVLTLDSLRHLVPGYARPFVLDRFPDRVEIAGGGDVEVIEVVDGRPEQDRLGGPDDEAVVIFTSAMSGRARGAVLTHRNLVANLESTTEALALTSNDLVFAALPFAHAFGFTVCLNSALAVGATVLPVPRFNPVTALELIACERPTVLCGVPAMFIGLLSAAEKKGAPEHALRVVLCGGAPLPIEVCRRWEETFGVPLRQGYGLTEAAPVCLFNRVDRPNHLGTLGEALRGVEISIRDSEGQQLAPGEVGELCVRGENVFGGYLSPAEGSSPFFNDWLRTGDLASMDGEVVRFRGTLKEMFTRNGFNVYPEEIRRVLTADPRIREAVVHGRPDPQRENEIVLTVQARPGADLSEDDVKDLCTTRLAAYKQPTVVRIRR